MIKFSDIFKSSIDSSVIDKANKLRYSANKCGIKVSTKEYNSIVNFLRKSNRSIFTYSSSEKIFKIVFFIGDTSQILELSNYVSPLVLFNQGVFGEPVSLTEKEIIEGINYLKERFILSENDLDNINNIYITNHQRLKVISNSKDDYEWVIINKFTNDILYKPDKFNRRSDY